MASSQLGVWIYNLSVDAHEMPIKPAEDYVLCKLGKPWPCPPACRRDVKTPQKIEDDIAQTDKEQSGDSVNKS